MTSWALSPSSIRTPVTLHYPGLEIRLDQRRVLKNNQDVQLSKYEYGVLCFLATHPGCVLTKEQVFEEVWHEDSDSCLSAVGNAIGRIRKKIEDDRENPVYIQTAVMGGYIFAVEPI